MANRKPRRNALLTVDEVYRQPGQRPEEPVPAVVAIRGVAQGAQLVGDHAEDADAPQLPLYPVG